MKVTEVRIRLIDNQFGNVNLKAKCVVIVDDMFAIHDMKVIEGKHGLFVAMPQRKICDHCDVCDAATPLLSKYCQVCGILLENRDIHRHSRELSLDIVHPVTNECREEIENKVLSAYQQEVDRFHTNRGVTT